MHNQSSISQIRRQLGGINLQIPCSPDPLLSPCSLIPCALPPLVPLWLCLNYAKQTQFTPAIRHRGPAARRPLRDLRGDTRYAIRDTTSACPFGGDTIYALSGHRPNCLLTLRTAARRILIDYRKRLQRTTLALVGKVISRFMVSLVRVEDQIY